MKIADHKNYEYEINVSCYTHVDGVNQICESTDQKNSLQCVNHDLHVARSDHEYAFQRLSLNIPCCVWHVMKK